MLVIRFHCPLKDSTEARETWIQIPTPSYQTCELGQIISFLLALATFSVNEGQNVLPQNNFIIDVGLFF